MWLGIQDGFKRKQGREQRWATTHLSSIGLVSRLRQSRAGRIVYGIGVLVLACVVAYYIAIGLAYAGMSKLYAGSIAGVAWGVIVAWLDRPA